MLPALPVIKAFIGRIPAVAWVGIGSLLVILLLSAKLAWVNHVNERLESDLVLANNQVTIAQGVNKEVYQDLQDVNARLENCVQSHVILKERSLQAARNFEKALEKVKSDVDEETQRVREALQNETCAMVAVPSDVENLLREGSTRGSDS